jgi:hypothetical protein
VVPAVDSTARRSSDPKPDFFVIGAGRAGTTSLHHYLLQHPQIFIPPHKSPSYFYAKDLSGSPLAQAPGAVPPWFVRTEAEYRRLFESPDRHRIAGDVSPVYLASTKVAARIAQWRPDAKLIAIMRHPAERVHSRYVARLRDGLEHTPTFEELVERECSEELVREDAHATYLAGGMVSHFLRTYLEHFPARNISIYFFEDLARDAAAVMADMCRFLGVDDAFDFDLGRVYNRSDGRARNRTVARLWAGSEPLRRSLRPLIPKPLRDAAFRRVMAGTGKTPIGPRTRARLIEIYRQDILELQALTRRDLSGWLNPERAHPTP